MDRPWRNTIWSTCKGFCAGHYWVEMVDTTDQSTLKSSAPSPSVVLKTKLTAYPNQRVLCKNKLKKLYWHLITQKSAWTTFTLCCLIVNEEQQKPQQLNIPKSLWRNPHVLLFYCRVCGESGSAVISGAVGNVRTCRLHLVLIIIFCKKCSWDIYTV